MQSGAQTRGRFGCYRQITKLFAINQRAAQIYRSRDQILIHQEAHDLTFVLRRFTPGHANNLALKLNGRISAARSINEERVIEF